MIEKEREPAPTPNEAEHDIEEAIERSYGKKMTEPLRQVEEKRGATEKPKDDKA